MVAVVPRDRLGAWNGCAGWLGVQHMAIVGWRLTRVWGILEAQLVQTTLADPENEVTSRFTASRKYRDGSSNFPVSTDG